LLRKKIVRVSTEDDFSSIREKEITIALETDRAGEPLPFRYNDMSTT
jgi:hypothetical protein